MRRIKVPLHNFAPKMQGGGYARGGAYLRDTTVHCTKKYLGGKHYYWKVKHARQFFRCCHAVLSVLSCFFCCYSSSLPFGLLLLLFTPRLCSPNSLFPLLVFIVASQSRSSCGLLYVCLLLFIIFSPYSLLPTCSLHLLSLLIYFLVLCT